jgi:hypothetical protein
MSTSLKKLFALNQENGQPINPLLTSLEQFNWVKNDKDDHPDTLYSFVETLTFNKPASTPALRQTYTVHYAEFFEVIEKLAIVKALDLDLPGIIRIHRTDTCMPSFAGPAWVNQLLTPGNHYAEFMGDDKSVAINLTGSIIHTEEGASLGFKLELLAVEQSPTTDQMTVTHVLK